MVPREEVEKLIKMSFLKFEESDVPLIGAQLGKIVGYIEKLDRFPELEEINPAKQVNVFREDKIEHFDSSEVVKSFAEENENYLVVPKFH